MLFLHLEMTDDPVGWDCRIHRLYLCRGVRLPYECPINDTKQSDSEAPLMLELWEIGSTPLLPPLPGLLWPVGVAPNSFLPMGQIEIN